MTPFNVAIVRWIRGAFDFRGRSTRAEYWWPRALVALVNLTLLMTFIVGGGADWLAALVEWSEQDPMPTDFSGLDLPPLPGLAKFAAVFYGVFGVLTFFPDLAVAWRRFHDLSQPGWLHLVFMVFSPLFVFVIVLELAWFIVPGTKGPNRYGPDPLEAQADAF